MVRREEENNEGEKGGEEGMREREREKLCELLGMD
jgi:hypothetical protein